MRLTFLGTGAAWSLPEIGCSCLICIGMRRKNETRSRTALYLEAKERVLIDCGPDVARQWWANSLGGVDTVLITHEHGDHYLGLDELVALRRSSEPEEWCPISTFATEATWAVIERQFAYLLEKTLEKRLAVPGRRLTGLRTRIRPFKTFHGSVAKGSVGYVFEDAGKRLVYTSDLLDVEGQEDLVRQPHVLVIQTHWINEPQVNRPSLLSLQRALPMIRSWEPQEGVYLVHISDADRVAGDPANKSLKKVVPADPLKDPQTGVPYPIPTCQDEWQKIAERIFQDNRIKVPVQVAYDGLTVEI
ncbi:MAG: MBL fold metallo-hydrolase [Deltaproteobacteria bacterium]|nr:MAG: MBL fold metallo-hydrolase [Deltaproteobacteria bacterium]